MKAIRQEAAAHHAAIRSLDRAHVLRVTSHSPILRAGGGSKNAAALFEVAAGSVVGREAAFGFAGRLIS
jgi:hypothetical protein